jgi:hypothetical protein
MTPVQKIALKLHYSGILEDYSFKDDCRVCIQCGKVWSAFHWGRKFDTECPGCSSKNFRVLCYFRQVWKDLIPAAKSICKTGLMFQGQSKCMK